MSMTPIMPHLRLLVRFPHIWYQLVGCYLSIDCSTKIIRIKSVEPVESDRTEQLTDDKPTKLTMILTLWLGTM